LDLYLPGKLSVQLNLVRLEWSFAVVSIRLEHCNPLDQQITLLVNPNKRRNGRALRGAPTLKLDEDLADRGALPVCSLTGRGVGRQ
jgi:hypothetical protein